ncbi:MAG: uncharacterized protein A8A55_0015 [Amphiamblys sp. WSBS2006]|nr:MAG: uncharacterized protein A8A55_0015 [Amphiamblys sp. WSBS2006]
MPMNPVLKSGEAHGDPLLRKYKSAKTEKDMAGFLLDSLETADGDRMEQLSALALLEKNRRLLSDKTISLFHLLAIRKAVGKNETQAALCFLRHLLPNSLDTAIETIIEKCVDTDDSSPVLSFLFSHYPANMNSVCYKNIQNKKIREMFLRLLRDFKQFLRCVFLIDRANREIFTEASPHSQREIEAGLLLSREIIETHKEIIPDAFPPINDGLFLNGIKSLQGLSEKIDEKQTLLAERRNLSQAFGTDASSFTGSDIFGAYLEKKLYEKAFHLCGVFGIDPACVFRRLALCYVEGLARRPTDEERKCFAKEGVVCGNRPASFGFSVLLKQYTEKYRGDGAAREKDLAQAVLEKSENVALPGWLERYLWETVPDRLLALFIHHGQRTKAFSLCVYLLKKEIAWLEKETKLRWFPYKHLIEKTLDKYGGVAEEKNTVRTLFFLYCEKMEEKNGGSYLKNMV